MTLGSLFDGSGTCPLAAAMCGITPVWASEIEPYPIRVTRKNFPSMREKANLADLLGETPAASWETVTRLPGACWTPNTGACPKDAKESSLSAILQADAPEKYSLSARACLGILKRAEKRGKKIPAMLWEALVETVERSTCSKTPSADR